MAIDIAYGSRTLHFIPPDVVTWLGTLDIAEAPELNHRDEAIREALRRPIGLKHGLDGIVKPGETVAVIVSDAFRQTRADQVLPILIGELADTGIPDTDIQILFATGIHRAPRRDEQARILGPAIFRRFKDRAFPHNPRDESNLVSVGTTSRGTPVIVNRRAVEADRRIVIGAVVFHYFGGFGGGRKSILPGLASVESIARNHSMNLDPVEDRLNPDVRIGILDGNPVAEDMLEAARLVGVDFTINTVLNRHAQIAAVFAGELDAAHRAAADYARRLFAAPITERADLVVANAGPSRNFVQSHKALYNAYQAVKPDGRIVFVARCEEGLGGEAFSKWIRLGDRQAIIAGLRRHSEINGQTALSTVEKAPIALFVTDMTDEDVHTLGGRKSPTLEQAIATALSELAPRSPITGYIMPSAAYTVPLLCQE
ncbi:MAG TPA: nickel-dependent lactate racemase [Candidatus Hydrogenedentes bacterium]|nr:nickel-dependent lactate racemase [Candidatus Hydrogenedentota bacterium]HPC16240.1 nickel-dependent lactate racemase [Candidatus Hydrogenedentota bacterium]HRT18548.1 nickel-dependent lactate racemase [Candidatus Hydrogenedentota bacterium]HRT63567.1 nickel-dependent lactate racemase [Candidatus Hydrogenedentota bacterium]